MFKSRPAAKADLDFQKEIDSEKSRAKGGRRTMQIKASAPQQVNIEFFKILEKLGNGAFGYVYLVCPKKQHKSNKAPANLYAMKILEKEKVIQ